MSASLRNPFLTNKNISSWYILFTSGSVLFEYIKTHEKTDLWGLMKISHPRYFPFKHFYHHHECFICAYVLYISLFLVKFLYYLHFKKLVSPKTWCQQDRERNKNNSMERSNKSVLATTLDKTRQLQHVLEKKCH